MTKFAGGSLVEYSLKAKGIIRNLLILFSNCIALTNTAVLFWNLLLGKIYNVCEVS